MAGPLGANPVGPVNRVSGRTGEQDISPPSLVIKLQRLQATGGAEHHDRRILLVFRRCRDLCLGQFERDAVALVGDASKMQRIPVDDYFSAADAQKAAEIDDRRAYRTGAVDDHVDDTSHILFGRAADLASKHTVRVPRADNGDRRRWRRLLWRAWQSGILLLRWWWRSRVVLRP